MPNILIRMPDMAFIASAQALMVEPVVMTSSSNKTFEYLLAGLAFCLFYAGQGRGVDRDSCDGSDAACDPFRLVITSLPHSLRMERNRQKEIDGVE